MFTDRDHKSSLYSNIRIDWGKWDSYISDLVCRCAEKAAENNYRFFGLQFFGKFVWYEVAVISNQAKHH